MKNITFHFGREKRIEMESEHDDIKEIMTDIEKAIEQGWYKTTDTGAKSEREVYINMSRVEAIEIYDE